jgi:hypothetical protein
MATDNKPINPLISHDSATSNDTVAVSSAVSQPTAIAAGAVAVGPVGVDPAEVTETDLEVPLPVGEGACRRIKPLADAIPEEELPRINANLNVMTITAWGAMPRIKAMRPLIVTNMPKHDLTLFDAFEDIVLALSYTDAVVRASTEDRRELKAQAETVEEYRRVLFDVGTGLARVKLIDGKPLTQINKEAGYKPLVRDMVTLVQLFRQNWMKIGGKVPLTLLDLDKFDRDAIALGTAIGLKEQSPEGPREVSLQRQRVYTLFRRAIVDIRKAAIYLYGEHGVDQVVPPFANVSKNGGKSASEQSEATDDEGIGIDAATTEGAPANSTAANPIGALRSGTRKSTTPSKKNGDKDADDDLFANFTVNNPDNLPITDPFGRDGNVS